MTPSIYRWQSLARTGENAWWRYCLGVAICLGFTIVLGGLAATLFAVAMLALEGLSFAQMGLEIERFFTAPSVSGFVGNNIPFIFGILGLALALSLCHGRSLGSLLGAEPRLRWRPLLAALGLWCAIVSSLELLIYGLAPQEFAWTFRLGSWIPLLLVTLPLTFLQVACEELFFRGYLLQGLGLVIRSKALLAVVAALPFALVHFANPEMQRGAVWMALHYLAFGILANGLTLKRDRLEPALGFHLANNFFGILIVSSTDSVLPVPAIFTVDGDGNAMVSFWVFVAEATLFWWLLHRRSPRQRRRWDSSALGEDCASDR